MDKIGAKFNFCPLSGVAYEKIHVRLAVQKIERQNQAQAPLRRSKF